MTARCLCLSMRTDQHRLPNNICLQRIGMLSPLLCSSIPFPMVLLGSGGYHIPSSQPFPGLSHVICLPWVAILH